VTAAAVELATAHVAFGVLGLAAAMFGLAWLLGRAPADGAFAIQALITAIAVPGYAAGWYAPLGRWTVPASVLVTAAAAHAAVEFTRLHLGLPPPRRIRQLAVAAATGMILGGATSQPRATVLVGLVFSWGCILYAIGAHAPLLRGGTRARAYVLLAAWTIVGVGSVPYTMSLLEQPTLLPINTLPTAAAIFAALHAFVLVAEHIEALRTARRQARELDALDLELRRQIRKRADDLAAGASRMLAALRVTPDALPEPGALVDGRYRLERELGRGGMGVVFAARGRDGTAFALKVLHGRPSTIDVARFAREARMAAQVRHPNVVRIHDLGLGEDGRMYVVMELIDGEPIGRRPERGQRRAIASGIAEGLAAIHELGIVHRDIKPSNVLIDRTTHRPRITDFGLATPTAGEALLATGSMDLGGSSPGAAITQGSSVLGTPFYMAPELRRTSHDAPAASDIYALGLVLFELFVGQRPFDAPAVFVPTSLPDGARDALISAAGPEVADVVARCLALDPAERPTASEVARLLA